MRKLAGLFVLFILWVAPALAQDTTPNAGQETTPPAAQAPAASPAESEKPKAAIRYTLKFELSAGYTHRSYYVTGAPKIGMNGWYGSFDYNWKHWLGAEAEVLGVYKQLDVNQKLSIYTMLAGPRLYPLGHRKLTPFGHVLYGAGYYRLSTSPIGGFGSNLSTNISHAWEVGGGLDLNRWNHWGFRLVQLDYGSTHFYGGSSGQGSYRVSFGVVYRFGER